MTFNSLTIKPALQSVINGATGQVIGYEVLARWTDGILALQPHHGTPYWPHVDQEIISCLSQGAEHISQLDARLFINVSQKTLESDRDFECWSDKVLDFLWLVNLPVTIEIVEDVQDDTLKARWGDLERLGATLSLDDFGKNHSTLDRLRKYKWDFCKFDIQDEAIASTALEFCQKQSISIIAERVEDERWAQKAFHYGLEQHQGYLYGLPFFLQEVEENAPMA